LQYRSLPDITRRKRTVETGFMNFLYGIPAIVVLLAALALSIALAAAGQTIVHRRFRSQNFIAHNEVGGIIIAVSGTMYAVVLGFLTVVVWQHYQSARDVVVQESDAAIDAWHVSVGLPADMRERVRSDMIAYANIMVDKEWPRMKIGAFNEDAAMISMDAIDRVGGLVPANSGESNAQVATMQQLGILHDARQQRIATNYSGVSGFEWLVLTIGAACIIAFCWLFGFRNARMHLLMTSTVVTIIVSTLVMLFELQYPFRSDIGIAPDAWQGALAHIHEMQSGSMDDMRK
jgi:hypothetical protein